jgi:hypothetical protein
MKDQEIDDYNLRNETVECQRCGACNRIKQQSERLKYRCGFCHSEIPNPLHSKNEDGDRICQQCFKALTNEPAILVDGGCYCFFHAKQLYPKIVDSHKKREKEINIDFDELMTQFKRKRSTEENELQNWHRKRSEYSRDNGFSKWKWAWCLVIVVGLILLNAGIGILAAIPCLLAVPFIDEWFQEQRNLEFDANFPPPACDPNLSAPVYKSLPRPELSMHPSNHEAAFVNTGYDRLAILRRDQNRCQNCGKLFQPELLEVHHVNPVSKGGCDFSRNLTTLCKKCHLVEDWFGHVHKERASFGLVSRRRKQ